MKEKRAPAPLLHLSYEQSVQMVALGKSLPVGVVKIKLVHFTHPYILTGALGRGLGNILQNKVRS